MRSARWLPVLVWVGISAPAFLVEPSGDDWKATLPLTEFHWGYLLPGFFWRPLEGVVRYLGSLHPALYPSLAHALTVLGHGTAAWLLYRLVRRTNRGAPWPAVVAAVLFLAHPAVVGVVWSVDGVIRAWSTACGLAALHAYRNPHPRIPTWLWLVLSGMSGLCYEAGVRWFLAVPWLHAAVDALEDRADRRPATGRLVRGCLAGLVAFAGYFVLRRMLGEDSGFSGTGRYAFVTDVVDWATHALMLVGVSATTVDTISLFRPEPRHALAAATFLFGLPLAIVCGLRVARSWPLRTWLYGATFVLLVLAPHLPQAHVSEFYAHPVVAAVVALMAAGTWTEPGATRGRTVTAFALAAFLAAAIAVDAHKLTAMIRSGREADRVGRAIAERLVPAPERLCVVHDSDLLRHGYSVFLCAPAPASGWGLAAKRHWGWDAPVRFSWVADAGACPGENAIVDLSLAGDVRVVRPRPGPSP